MTAFEVRREGDVLRSTTSDGLVHEVSYLRRAGTSVPHVRTVGVRGRAVRPVAHGDVAKEGSAGRSDAPVPGRERRGRDGYESRPDGRARATARAPGRRRREVVFRFDEVADEIDPARAKRKWMVAVAAWTLHSDVEPDKHDPGGNDPTEAEAPSRPRPRDIDPDTKVRRVFARRPGRAVADPLSTRDTTEASRAAGSRAKVGVFGDMSDDAARLPVESSGRKRQGRFPVQATRDVGGSMAWTVAWARPGEGVDGARERRREASGTSAAVAAVVADGFVPAAPGKASEPARSAGATEGRAQSAGVRP